MASFELESAPVQAVTIIVRRFVDHTFPVKAFVLVLRTTRPPACLPAVLTEKAQPQVGRFDPSMVEGGRAERFLRGEDAGEDDFLSNDELGILLGMINEGEETSEEGSRPNKEKFTRSSKKEMKDFFAKHAAKRKSVSYTHLTLPTKRIV